MATIFDSIALDRNFYNISNFMLVAFSNIIKSYETWFKWLIISLYAELLLMWSSIIMRKLGFFHLEIHFLMYKATVNRFVN